MPSGVPNKQYTPEFKKLVVETMQRKNLGYRETAERFGVRHKRVQDRERICLTEGAEGFAVERRGRGSSARPKKLPKEAEEDLPAEVQRLRAENECLKNLQAFHSTEHLKQELLTYLDYYNNRRIKAKLKGLPSALHRQQALSAA